MKLKPSETIHRVVFFQVDNSQKKLLKIAQIAYFHFCRKQHFLILTTDEKTALFVNECLWKIPRGGFLPHVVATQPSEEWVVITEKKENLNHARFIFNLCPLPVFWTNSHLIYELDDLTSSAKQMLSRKKYDAYKEKKYLIEGR